MGDRDDGVVDERGDGGIVDPLACTISSVMPVSAVTSGGMGTDGSLKAENVSVTATMRPSAE
jgi:hypothetical protein